MGNRIEYVPGELLGPYNIKFIKEVAPHITDGGSKKRQAIFCCPVCNKNFISQIPKIKNGSRKTCQECSEKRRVNSFKRDLTGQRFGKLIVLYDTGERRHEKVVYHCKCDCGREKDIVGASLTQGLTQSCGFCIRSLGEEKIKKILQELNIEFEEQKIFDNCINSETKRNLRFDFYLPKYNICIEYDGEQHYTGWRGQKDSLKRNQKLDNIKNSYCKQFNINLIRIPYWEFNNIDTAYIQNIIQT